MVDCGATSNFISKQLVEEMKLKVSNTPKYAVELGTRVVIKNKGVCKKLNLQVQGVDITQKKFILE